MLDDLVYQNVFASASNIPYYDQVSNTFFFQKKMFLLIINTGRHYIIITL